MPLKLGLMIGIALASIGVGGFVWLTAEQPSHQLRSHGREASLSLAKRGVWLNRSAHIPAICYRVDPAAKPLCTSCHEQREPTAPSAPMRWSNALAAAPAADLPLPEGDSSLTKLVETLLLRGWEGFLPDIRDYELGEAAFDHHGLARDGSGWLAYSAHPHPSTSAYDAATTQNFVRLPYQFRLSALGEPSRETYFANLALLRMAISGEDFVGTPPMDEEAFGLDLDRDRQLLVALSIGRRSQYLGGAASFPVHVGRYPIGTEFMQILSYAPESGEMPPRVREIRYAVKESPAPPRSEHVDEGPARLPLPTAERGFDNGAGWRLQGFIEDAQGALRPQTAEELASCAGCHGGLAPSAGADGPADGPIDTIWSFQRMLDGQYGLGLVTLQPEKGSELAASMADWLDGRESAGLPSEQAHAANRGYARIVREQSYLYGRLPAQSGERYEPTAAAPPTDNASDQTEQGPLTPSE
ncbi:MAG: hypothetical protein MRY63_07410 [Neomegalonema sp.]|nr:hypothetical protein [Neomegalonema sp.]